MLHQDPEVGHYMPRGHFIEWSDLMQQQKNISKTIPDYMAEQIAQFIADGGVKVLKPKPHKQSARAFPRGGRGAIWYNKEIKGTK